MFKKKKHGALKALKSLAPSTKVRSKYEFTFCVESIEDVALEAKKQVGLSYHIRKSAEKGCLPPQEVPSSKRVLFDKYFTVKAKFTHVNHKIQKDKILKIDLMDISSKKVLGTVKIKLSEMISVNPDKDLSLLFQLPRKLKARVLTTLHMTCKAELVRYDGRQVVRASSASEDRESCVVNGEEYLLGDYDESEFTNSSAVDSDEDTDTDTNAESDSNFDPFTEDTTMSFDTPERDASVSEAESPLPARKNKKTKRKLHKSRETSEGNTEGSISSPERKSKPITPTLVLDDLTSLERSEADETKPKRSPRIPRIITSKVPSLFKEEKSKELEKPTTTRSLEMSPLTKSPTRQERANERFALQKTLVDAELEYAQISAENAKLEKEQDRMFRSTVELKNELNEVRSVTSRLQIELDEIEAGNKVDNSKMTRIQDAFAQAGSPVIKRDDRKGRDISEQQDRRFVYFLLVTTLLTLLSLSVI